MPNTKSAIKRTRSTEHKQQVNRAIKSRIGTLERKFNDLVREGNKDGVTSALKDVASAYDKAAKKGVIHRNKADNKKSRLSKVANALN
ncbi:MAG: 30S ribosomal protein S20 [Verrucomicrobia bacterium]|jgi:small subunit ribosomal protein S20|nr:30S ribosomal protein S20 [Verrucomicrobiota bacterium]